LHVTYLEGDHGSLSGTAVTSGLSLGDTTPAAPTVIPDAHWEFSHWDPTPTTTVTGDATYTAQYTPVEYTVTYDPGLHGTFTAQVTTGLNYGDATPAAPATPGDAGWSFNGWSPTPTTTVEGNATYVAQWTQDEYTVRYEPGTQGTFSVQETTGLHYGDATPTAPTPTGNAGFTFTGWNPTPTPTVTGNATYVAQWSTDEYTVRYEPGAHGTFTAQETTGLNYGDATPTAPATPGDPGWTFTGWSPTPTTTVTGNATYVAQWTQDEYVVRYEPGTHGTFTAQETSGLNYGDATPAAPATPGDPGWTFTGWDPTPAGTVTGNATYTAQWSQNEYTVTYEPGAHGTFTAQETTGLNYGDSTPTAPATPGDPGWTFTGWSPVPSETVTGDATYVAQWSQDEYTVTYEPGLHGTFTAQETSGLNYGDTTPAAPATPGDPGWTFTGWSPVPSETVTGDATYVAQWSQDEYTVTYEPGAHGTFTAQETTGLHYGADTPDAPATPGDPGWTFTGWSPVPSETVTGDATYVAQWSQDEYTVRYEPGTHGTFTAQETSGLNYGDTTPAAPATPGDPGWTFVGWNPVPTETVTGDATYVAQWSQDEYTVTYEPGAHGTFTAQETTGLNYGDSTPTAPATPGDPGWTFTGWSPVPSETVTGDATYVAQWSQDEYTVRYEPGTHGTFTTQETTGLNYGDSTPVAPATPGEAGFTFTGWNPIPSETVTGDATYVAQWSEDEYTVTYEPGDHGTFTAQVTSELTYGEDTPAAPATPGEPGWIFAGWAPTPSEIVTGDATYTAQWRPEYYTVTYEPGTHGTFTAQVTSELTYGEDTPAAPATPGEAGWQFEGWSPIPAETVTADATYVAQWSLIPVYSINIDKTVSPGVVTQGQMVTFTVTVTNTGNTSLTNIVVTDSMFSEPIVSYSLLAPGASETVTYNYFTDSGDVPGFVNTATVTALALQEIPVSDTDTASVTVNPPFVPPVFNPGISVTIEPDADLVQEGEEVTFTMVVTNTGDTVLNNVQVLNADLDFSDVIPILYVGTSQTFTVVKTMDEAGEFTFTVVAEGTSPQVVAVSDTDITSVEVFIVPPIEPPPLNPPTGAIPFNALTVSGLMTLGAGILALIRRKKEDDEEE